MSKPSVVHLPDMSKPRLMRWLLLVGLSAFLLRLWISMALPVTGDEAYFYWWGIFRDWGYYDHPPMAGWWMSAMQTTLGHAPWAIRLPAVLLPVAMGAVIWWTFLPLDRDRAGWAVLLFWLAPLNWLNALITTDTPLMFWSLLSMACLVRAELVPKDHAPRWGLYTASGLFLSLAFLSKYFAVVLGFAYVVYFVLYRRDRWPALLLLCLCALPGPLINLAWNASHGWANIMFNVFNRHQSSGVELHKPLLYLAMLAYLVTPGALWLIFKHRRVWRDAWGSKPAVSKLVVCLLVVPLVFFGCLSLKKVVGLHWVFSFYPMLFVFMAFSLPKASLKRCAQALAAFTALHVLIVGLIATTSLEQWQGKSHYFSLVRAFRTAQILEKFESPGTVLMADAYSPASVYGYVRERYVPVFGPGSFHARQDDFETDFSQFQGQTIRVLLSDPAVLSDFAPYFDSVKAVQIEQDGATFYGVEGVNFNYPAYRDGVLRWVYQRYYNIPSWLPMTDCPFCRKVCGEPRCAP